MKKLCTRRGLNPRACHITIAHSLHLTIVSTWPNYVAQQYSVFLFHRGSIAGACSFAFGFHRTCDMIAVYCVKITTVEGLENLVHLEHLDLSNNYCSRYVSVTQVLGLVSVSGTLDPFWAFLVCFLSKAQQHALLRCACVRISSNGTRVHTRVPILSNLFLRCSFSAFR